MTIRACRDLHEHRQSPPCDHPRQATIPSHRPIAATSTGADPPPTGGIRAHMAETANFALYAFPEICQPRRRKLLSCEYPRGTSGYIVPADGMVSAG